jgi:hypothetical protein
METTLFNKLNSLKVKIYSHDGLGLKKIVDERLECFKTPIPDNKQQEYSKTAKILKEIGKIDDSTSEEFINTIHSKRLVFENGKYHYSNKLNTNYSQIASILSKGLIKLSKTDHTVLDIINLIVSSNNLFYDLIIHKKTIQNIFKELLTDDIIFNSIEHIIKTSTKGQQYEDNLREILDKSGFEIVYQGGDGDFIDMLFGIDLIVKSPNGRYHTIQVKSSIWDGKRFLSDYRAKYVDIIYYPDPTTKYGFSRI